MPPQPPAHRILIVVPKLSVGGTERHLLAILPRLDRARFRIEVATTRGAGPLDQALRAQGIPVTPAPTLFPGHAYGGDSAPLEQVRQHNPYLQIDDLRTWQRRMGG